jgi:hypothetical protein
MVHSVTIRKEIADRVLQRRGRYHLFDRLDPARTALVAIDMQNTFCARVLRLKCRQQEASLSRSTFSPPACALCVCP